LPDLPSFTGWLAGAAASCGSAALSVDISVSQSNVHTGGGESPTAAAPAAAAAAAALSVCTDRRGVWLWIAAASTVRDRCRIEDRGSRIEDRGRFNKAQSETQTVNNDHCNLHTIIVGIPSYVVQCSRSFIDWDRSRTRARYVLPIQMPAAEKT
jgi:hypothetical protein